MAFKIHSCLGLCHSMQMSAFYDLKVASSETGSSLNFNIWTIIYVTANSSQAGTHKGVEAFVAHKLFFLNGVGGG